ncbi:VWA domain-containing protein [Leptolyngbya sp. 15MV]|nr:VWA domain-containing protein [Leptolyngbya sp. 15MV]
MDLVISMLRSFVELNGTDDQVFLVTFTDSDNINIRQEMTTNKEELEDEIENIFIQPGRTAIIDALWAAADYLVDSSKNVQGRYLILISDGDERASRVKLPDLVAKLKNENIAVYIMGIAEQKVETKLLDKIAKESGGRLFVPQTRPEVLETAQRIRQEIRSR